MARLLSWPEDIYTIHFHISTHVAPLKIGVKTKNNFFFIRDWIDHHIRIIDPRCIFIADNHTTDPLVLDYYASLPDEICIFRFSGLHNDIHDRAMYPELHSALLLSTSYFQILDADERLVWLKPDGYLSDASLVKALMDLQPQEAAFGVWIANIGGQREWFIINPKSVLLSGIQWGKSLFSSQRMMPIGQRLHNCQLPETVRSTFTYPPHICVLHLKNLSKEERLQSEREKLIARKAILPDASLAEIAQSPLLEGALPGSVYYLEQLKRLVSGELGYEYSEEAKRHAIHFRPDGTLLFSSEETRQLYRELFDQPQSLARTAFSEQPNLQPR